MTFRLVDPFDDPRESEMFLLGPTVITLRAGRRISPPTEHELIRDELRTISETKSRWRRSGRK